MFDEPQLAALCLECLDKNTPEALTADGFTDIDIDTLSAVLDRDSLRIKESKLFSAVLRYDWGTSFFANILQSCSSDGLRLSVRGKPCLSLLRTSAVSWAGSCTRSGFLS